MQTPNNKDGQQLPIFTPKNPDGSQRVIKQIMVIDQNKLRVAGLDLKMAEALKKAKGKSPNLSKDNKLALAKSMLNKKLKQAQMAKEANKAAKLITSPIVESGKMVVFTTPPPPKHQMKITNMKSPMPTSTSPSKPNQSQTMLLDLLKSEQQNNPSKVNTSLDSSKKEHIPKASTQKTDTRPVTPNILKIESKVISPDLKFGMKRKPKVELQPKGKAKLIEVKFLSSDAEVAQKSSAHQDRPKVVESKVLSPEEQINLNDLRVKPSKHPVVRKCYGAKPATAKTLIMSSTPKKVSAPKETVEESAIDFIQHLFEESKNEKELNQSTEAPKEVPTVNEKQERQSTEAPSEDATSFLLSIFGLQSMESTNEAADFSSFLPPTKVIGELPAEAEKVVELKDQNTPPRISPKKKSVTFESACVPLTNETPSPSKVVKGSTIATESLSTINEFCKEIPDTVVETAMNQKDAPKTPAKRDVIRDPLPQANALDSNPIPKEIDKSSVKDDQPSAGSARRKGRKSVPVLIAKLNKSRKPSVVPSEPPQEAPIVNSTQLPEKSLEKTKELQKNESNVEDSNKIQEKGSTSPQLEEKSTEQEEPQNTKTKVEEAFSISAQEQGQSQIQDKPSEPHKDAQTEETLNEITEEAKTSELNVEESVAIRTPIACNRRKLATSQEKPSEPHQELPKLGQTEEKSTQITEEAKATELNVKESAATMANRPYNRRKLATSQEKPTETPAVPQLPEKPPDKTEQLEEPSSSSASMLYKSRIQDNSSEAASQDELRKDLPEKSSEKPEELARTETKIKANTRRRGKKLLPVMIAKLQDRRTSHVVQEKTPKKETPPKIFASELDEGYSALEVVQNDGTEKENQTEKSEIAQEPDGQPAIANSVEEISNKSVESDAKGANPTSEQSSPAKTTETELSSKSIPLAEAREQSAELEPSSSEQLGREMETFNEPKAGLEVSTQLGGNHKFVEEEVSVTVSEVPQDEENPTNTIEVAASNESENRDEAQILAEEVISVEQSEILPEASEDTESLTKSVEIAATNEYQDRSEGQLLAEEEVSVETTKPNQTENEEQSEKSDEAPKDMESTNKSVEDAVGTEDQDGVSVETTKTSQTEKICLSAESRKNKEQYKEVTQETPFPAASENQNRDESKPLEEEETLPSKSKNKSALSKVHNRMPDSESAIQSVDPSQTDESQIQEEQTETATPRNKSKATRDCKRESSENLSQPVTEIGYAHKPGDSDQPPESRNPNKEEESPNQLLETSQEPLTTETDINTESSLSSKKLAKSQRSATPKGSKKVSKSEEAAQTPTNSRPSKGRGRRSTTLQKIDTLDSSLGGEEVEIEGTSTKVPQKTDTNKTNSKSKAGLSTQKINKIINVVTEELLLKKAAVESEPNEGQKPIRSRSRRSTAKGEDEPTPSTSKTRRSTKSKDNDTESASATPSLAESPQSEPATSVKRGKKEPKTKLDNPFDLLRNEEQTPSVVPPSVSTSRISIDSHGFEDCDADLSMAMIEVATAAEENIFKKDSPPQSLSTAKGRKPKNPFRKNKSKEKQKDETDFFGFNEQEIEEGQQSTTLRLSQSEDVSPLQSPSASVSKKKTTSPPIKKTPLSEGKKKKADKVNWKKNSAASLQSWLTTPGKSSEESGAKKALEENSIPLKKRRGRGPIVGVPEEICDKSDSKTNEVPSEKLSEPEETSPTIQVESDSKTTERPKEKKSATKKGLKDEDEPITSLQEKTIQLESDSKTTEKPKGKKSSTKKMSQDQTIEPTAAEIDSKKVKKPKEKKTPAKKKSKDLDQTIETPTSLKQETQATLETPEDDFKTPVQKKGNKRKRPRIEKATPEIEPPNKKPHIVEDANPNLNQEVPITSTPETTPVAEPLPLPALPILNPFQGLPRKRGRPTKLEASYPRPAKPAYVPIPPIDPLHRKFKNDSEFNPRLLLITEKEQLKTNEPLVDPDMQTEPKNKDDLQCALCMGYTPKKKWFHHVSTHYGVGWVVGTPPPLNVNSRSSVLNYMVEFFRASKVKGLNCRICKAQRRSGLGLFTHLEQCCLTEDEVKESRLVCEHCNNDYSKASLPIHLRTCSVLLKKLQAKEAELKPADESVPENEVLSNAGRLKRKSVIKAEIKIKNLDDAEFNPDELIKHIVGQTEDYYRAKWLQEIQAFGKGFCVQKKCPFTAQTVEEMVDHFQEKKCIFYEKPGYVCLKCKYHTDTMESCRTHVVKKHKPRPARDFDDSSEDAEIGSESSSESITSGDDENAEGSGTDATVDGEHKRRRKKKSKKSKSTLKVRHRAQKNVPTKDFKKLFSSERDYDIASQVARWYEDFVSEHYSKDPLFTFATPSATQTDGGNYEAMLPKSTESMKFILQGFKGFVEEFGLTQVPPENWTTLESLKGAVVPNEHIAYVGGPVKSIAWAPFEPHPESATQYLAVATRKAIDKFTRYVKQRKSGTLVYIQKYHLSETNELSGEIHYALPIDTGPIHCLEFLPSGGYAPEMNRLGLLAVGTVATEIKIYSLPLVVEKRDCDIFPIIRLEPAFVLCLEVDESPNSYAAEYKSQCMSIAWSQTVGHNYIIGGYVNGFVAIWDISEDDDNINRMMVNGVRKYVPVSYFWTTDNRIKQVVPHYDVNGLRWLAVCNQNRKLLLYDLLEINRPVLFYMDTTKNVCNSVDWPLVWENPSCGLGDAMPSHGKCINTISPMSLVFVNRRFDKFCCGVNDIHFNPWRNLYAGAGDNGDIHVTPLREAVLDVGLRMKVDEKVISTLDIVSLNGDTILKKQLDDFRLFEPNYKEKYGLVFGTLQRIMGSKQPSLYGEKRRPLLNVAHLIRVNRLRFNPNKSANRLLAVGYENGFVRVLQNNWHKTLKD